jgi:hypothetical protein
MPTRQLEPPHHPCAYGLRIRGLGPLPSLQRAASDAPVLDVRVVMATTTGRADHLGPDSASYHLGRGGYVRVTRSDATAHFVLPPHGPAPDAAALVHPYLVLPAATMQYWRGHLVLHAGAFILDGVAWAIAGDKGAGKSSTLGWLATQGVDVLSDDLLVVADGWVHAGPRCVDLRREAASQLGVGTCIGMIGNRERWRHELPDVAPVARLGGWIYPAWSPRLRMSAVPPAARLQRLTHNLALRVPPASPMQVLHTVALPTWEWTRPRDWRAIDDSITALLEHVTARADQPRPSR